MRLPCVVRAYTISTAFCTLPCLPLELVSFSICSQPVRFLRTKLYVRFTVILQRCSRQEFLWNFVVFCQTLSQDKQLPWPWEKLVLASVSAWRIVGLCTCMTVTRLDGHTSWVMWQSCIPIAERSDRTAQSRNTRKLTQRHICRTTIDLSLYWIMVLHWFECSCFVLCPTQYNTTVGPTVLLCVR